MQLYSMQLNEGNDGISDLNILFCLVVTVLSRSKNLQFFKEYFIEEKHSEWKL